MQDAGRQSSNNKRRAVHLGCSESQETKWQNSKNKATTWEHREKVRLQAAQQKTKGMWDKLYTEG